MAHGLLLGMTFHTSFVTGIIQFKTLPKLVFGNLQRYFMCPFDICNASRLIQSSIRDEISKQFPPYFAIQILTSLFLTWSSAAMRGLASPSVWTRLVTMESAWTWDHVTVALMGLSAICAATNGLLIGPWSTRVMFERHQLQKKDKEVPKSMDKLFGILHGVSSLLNLVTFGVAVAHCFWLATLINL